MAATPFEVDTPVGVARVHPEPAPRGRPVGRLVLGHGAGGGVGAPDLRAAARGGREAGFQVLLVEQPWRVAGRRVAEAPVRLDRAWLAVCTALDPTGPLVTGGRSAGARVACRTAAATGAAAVLCLSFPLVPPRRPGASRAAELALPAGPRLVVQGSRDPFGCPEPGPGVTVHVVDGAGHSFSTRAGESPWQAEVAEVVRVWLRGLVRR